MQSLSNIGSMLGIPLKTDKYTKEKSILKCARLLVEMPLEGHFSDYIEFANKKNVQIRQKVIYEWLPLKCSHCKMLGHTQENRRNQDIHRKEWRVRSQVLPQEQNQPSERSLSILHDTMLQEQKDKKKSQLQMTYCRPTPIMFCWRKMEARQRMGRGDLNPKWIGSLVGM
ncbi:hypothetical protein Cgig2_021541 [Carnegiea gigantea]|uniref:Uncharacterized protein n=1 Tax=Carnegiea gigantea TaxID=171969 RepID=A0A9Q1GIK5_9CARY|nr:hypothetical protein Cgig2_021541 [Carnegiea gigantea]